MAHTAPLTSSAAKAQFTKLFESLAYTQSYHSVFTDFLDYALLMFRWDKTPEDFRELEQRWPKQEDQKKFAAMLEMYSIAADHDGEGFHDALGDLFMELLSHGKNGQFFTPEPICQMISEITIGDSAQDGRTVCDPTCGSGRMLLAAARKNRRMIFYAADVDITCCKMTVLNMLANTMEGEVAWMNTLSMDHWRSWHIKKVMDGTGHYLPYYTITGAGETHFVERLRKSLEPEKPAAVEAPAPVDSESDELIVGKKNQLLLF